MSKNGKAKESWYYDANALDRENVIAEITNKRYPHRTLISHLAIAEAFGNILEKNGKEGAEYFLGLLIKIGPFIEIIGTDGSDSIFNDVRETFPRLSPTDALHLSTAIENNCCVLKSGDQDLLGLGENDNKAKLKAFAERHGVTPFAISRI